MSLASKALYTVQSRRVPNYPAWTKGFLFSEWSDKPELVPVPFDFGTSGAPLPGNIDFDELLDVFQNGVVDAADYITTIPNAEGGRMAAFAIFANHLDEESAEINTGVGSQLGLRFLGRILVLALDSSEEIVDLTIEDGPIVDRHVAQAIISEMLQWWR